jgi:hypothetical protein
MRDRRDEEGSGLLDIRAMAALQERAGAETLVSPPSLPVFTPLVLPVLTPAPASRIPWWVGAALVLATLLALGGTTLAWLAHRRAAVVVARATAIAPPPILVTPLSRAEVTPHARAVEANVAPTAVKPPRRLLAHRPRLTAPVPVVVAPIALPRPVAPRDAIDILLDKATGGK